MSEFAPIQGYIPTGNPNVAMAQHGNDRVLHVEFTREPKLMKYKSEQAGRPICEDRDYICITYAGGKSVLKREVRLEPDNNGGPSDPERFPKHWEAFQRQAEQAQSGTQLEMMPWLTKSQVFELKAQKIYTVEALANIPDSALTITGGRSLRERSQKYLAAADAGARESALEAKNKTLENDIEALKAQFAAFATAQAAPETTKRGPGRPRKEEGNDNAET